MKKIILLIFIIAPLFMHGQTFKAVAVAGFNASQVDGDNIAGYNKFGFNGGGKVHAMLNENFSLSVELLYSQKGARSRVDKAIPTNNLKISFDYAEVPLMVHYHDKDRAIFGVGASYNALLNYEIVQDDIDITDNIEEPGTKDINFLADLTFKFGHFGINGRFAYSIWPITQWDNSNFKNNNVYNNTVTFRAMYFF